MPRAGIQTGATLFPSHLHIYFALRAPDETIFQVFIDDLIEVRTKYAGAK
jgi:hypothetical protein